MRRSIYQNYLDWIIPAREFDFLGDPTDERIVVWLDGEGCEVALRVPARVDSDVVAGNTLVPLHPDYRLSNLLA